MPDPTPNAPNGSEKPVLLEAIEITVRTIDERMRIYRYLVLAICVVALGSICLTAVFRRAVPLAGFVILVPLVGGFFCLDSRRVRLWRADIFNMCRLRGLKVSDFCQTISQLRYLPAATLKGMLATLDPDVTSDDEKAAVGEQTVVPDLLAGQMLSYERKILLATGFLTSTLVALAGAAIYRSVVFLFCAVGCLLLLALVRRKSRK